MENYNRVYESEFGTYYYLNGEFHRIDGPAFEGVDGSKCWYQNGLLHRTDGPAKEFSDGDKEWWQNGLLHRIDGPAEEYNGTKYWWIDDVCYEPYKLQYLIENFLYLGKKEKGKHNLDWLRFLTDQGIKEFPIVPGMESYGEFPLLFNQLFEAPIK